MVPTRWSRDAHRRRLLALADLLAAGCASALLVSASGVAGGVWDLAYLPAWVLLAKLLGLYDRDHRMIRHLTIDEVPSILAWSVIGTGGLTLALSEASAGRVSASSVILAVLTGAVLGVIFRAGARAGWRRTTPVERCLIVGNGELAGEIRRKLHLFEDMHLSVEGEVDPAELSYDLGGNGNGGVSGVQDLDALMAGVQRVVIATTSLSPRTVGKFKAFCRERQVKLSVVSGLSGRALPAPRISQVADLPVFEYNTWDVSRTTVVLKRCFDVLGGLLLLIVVLPLLPLVAVAIKLDSRGPVFFRQQRAGRGGQPFKIVKFRTMNADAEDALGDLVSLDDLGEPMFKFRSDPRLTRVGRLLRRLSLDELPQIVNVLRGHMGLVGPRPEQLELVDRYRPEQRFRLDVKPGMTGPMQVYGRGNLTFPERLAVELDYIENLSIAQDVRILALTVPAVVKRRGAY